MTEVMSEVKPAEVNATDAPEERTKDKVSLSTTAPTAAIQTAPAIRINPSLPILTSLGLLIARLIFAGVFAVGAWFKFGSVSGLEAYLTTANMPYPLLAAWGMTVFEAVLAIAFLTGLWMRTAAFLAIVYVFLLSMFNGGEGNPLWFGAIIDHLIFTAGLLCILSVGPGSLSLKRRKR